MQQISHLHFNSLTLLLSLITASNLLLTVSNVSFEDIVLIQETIYMRYGSIGLHGCSGTAHKPCPLSQLKSSKMADPDDIAPDLPKHLSSKGSSVLLNILTSSCLSSLCMQSRCSAYVVQFHKRGMIQQTLEVTAQ